MKKFLFTLAALFVAGSAMAAPGTPCDIAMSVSENEITLNPGETYDVYIYYDKCDGLLNGLQFQYKMLDPAGEQISTSGAIKVQKKAGKWCQVVDADAWFPGAAHGQSTPTTQGIGIYRFLGTNSEANIYLYGSDYEDYDYVAPEFPMKAYKVTFTASADWADEYATFWFDNTYYKFSTGFLNPDTGYGQPDGAYTQTEMGDMQQMTIKINNGAYGQQEKTPFEATVTIGDLDGNQVPVSYTANDPDAVVTVTVNGEPVNVEFVEGKATVTLPDYGEYTIAMEVKVGNAEAYEGDPVSDSKIVNYAQPVADDPVITFVENENGSVTVNVDPYTTVAIHVNGTEENYYAAPVTIEQGYAEKVITVEAQNAPAGYVASATVTDEYTLAAKEKNAANAPTYTTDVTDTEVIITVVPDPNTDGELVILDADGNEVSNPIHVARGEQAATYTFTAYTAEGATYKQSAFLLNEEVEIPAVYVDPGQTPEPVVTIDIEATYYTITATGDGHIVLKVWTDRTRGYEEAEGEGEAYVVLPRYEEEDGYNITRVEATAEDAPKAISDVVVLTDDPEINVEVEPIAKAASQKPTFRVDYDDDYAYIYAEGTGVVTMLDFETGEALLDADGNNVNPIKVERPAYGEDSKLVYVRASNLDDGWYEPTEATDAVRIEPKAEKVYETPAPTVTAVQDDENMVITATGEGTVTLYVTEYDAEGNPTVHTVSGEGTATYSVARGDEDVMISYYATAEATAPAGYDSAIAGMTQAQTAWVDAKDVVLDPCAAPTFDAGIGDWAPETGHIVIINNEPGATVYYVIYKDGKVYKQGQFTEDQIDREISGVGVYTVEAYAAKNGMANSEVATFSYEIKEGATPTAVNEIVNGKTVAGVRYFNMAGQEMKEANGVTLIVTTYTDGTTSAVKVMK